MYLQMSRVIPCHLGLVLFALWICMRCGTYNKARHCVARGLGGRHAPPTVPSPLIIVTADPARRGDRDGTSDQPHRWRGVWSRMPFEQEERNFVSNKLLQYSQVTTRARSHSHTYMHKREQVP